MKQEDRKNIVRVSQEVRAGIERDAAAFDLPRGRVVAAYRYAFWLLGQRTRRRALNAARNLPHGNSRAERARRRAAAAAVAADATAGAAGAAGVGTAAPHAA